MRGLNLNSKYKIRLLLILIFITAIIIIIPTSSAQKKTTEGVAKIDSLDNFEVNIETAGGDAVVSWTILNYNKSYDKLNFSIENEDKNPIETIKITPSRLNHTYFNNKTGEYKKEIKLERGKFTFKWINGDDIESLDLDYKITYQKMGYEESTGCYTATFLIIFLSFAFIGVILKKNIDN